MSLGLWQKFGADHPFERQRQIVLHAFDLGIAHIDIANRYGPPHRAAEKFFGRLLETDLKHHRDEIVVSSKAGGPLGASPYLQGGSRKSLLNKSQGSSGDHPLPVLFPSSFRRSNAHAWSHRSQGETRVRLRLRLVPHSLSPASYDRSRSSLPLRTLSLPPSYPFPCVM